MLLYISKMNITSEITILSLPSKHLTDYQMHCRLVLCRGACMVYSLVQWTATSNSNIHSPDSIGNILEWMTNHISSRSLNKNSVYSSSTSYGLQDSPPALPRPGNSFVLPDLSREWPGVLRRLKSPTRSIRINTMYPFPLGFVSTGIALSGKNGYPISFALVGLLSAIIGLKRE